jgi:hypothetical protein
MDRRVDFPVRVVPCACACASDVIAYFAVCACARAVRLFSLSQRFLIYFFFYLSYLLS